MLIISLAYPIEPSTGAPEASYDKVSQLCVLRSRPRITSTSAGERKVGPDARVRPERQAPGEIAARVSHARSAPSGRVAV